MNISLAEKCARDERSRARCLLSPSARARGGRRKRIPPERRHKRKRPPPDSALTQKPLGAVRLEKCIWAASNGQRCFRKVLLRAFFNAGMTTHDSHLPDHLD